MVKEGRNDIQTREDGIGWRGNAWGCEKANQRQRERGKDRERGRVMIRQIKNE